MDFLVGPTGAEGSSSGVSAEHADVTHSDSCLISHVEASERSRSRHCVLVPCITHRAHLSLEPQILSLGVLCAFVQARLRSLQ